MKTLLSFALLFSLTLVVHGCFSSKKVVSENALDLKRKSAKSIQKLAQSSDFTAQWLHGVGKIALSDPSVGNLSATVDVRYKKDEFIWMQIKKFGFEAARILVRPDSAFVINRLQKTYLALGAEAAMKQYDLPLDFGLLQTLFLGNALFLDNQEFDATIEGSFYQLTGEDQRFTTQQWLRGDNFRNHKMLLTDKKSRQSVTCFLEDFKLIENRAPLAFTRKFELERGEKGASSIAFDFDKVNLDEALRTPFSIPQGYAPM